jgi:hypothetical protein
MVAERTPPSSRWSLATVGKREPVLRREGCWTHVRVSFPELGSREVASSSDVGSKRKRVGRRWRTR